MPTNSIQSPAVTRDRSLAGRMLASLETFVVRWQQNRAARALSGLSDYMLEDMGISRSDIQAVARGSRELRARRSDDGAQA